MEIVQFIHSFLRLVRQIHRQKNESGLECAFYTSDLRPTDLQIKQGDVYGTAPHYLEHSQFIKSRK